MSAHDGNLMCARQRQGCGRVLSTFIHSILSVNPCWRDAGRCHARIKASKSVFAALPLMSIESLMNSRFWSRPRDRSPR